MEITASSKYDWETIKKFNYFHNFKRSKFLNVIHIIIIVCFFINLINTTMSLVLDYFDSEILLSFLTVVIVTFLLVLIYFVLPKTMFKKNKVGKNSENKFVFKEKVFEIEGGNGDVIGKSEIKYAILHKVYETKKFLYVYINPRQAYIVDKETVSDEVALRDLLISEVGNKKYIFKVKEQRFT